MSRKKTPLTKAPAQTHSVYAIELPAAVAMHKTFRDQNPHYKEGQVCLYVGMTGLSAQQRYDQHRTGHKKAARPCKRYGVIRLAEELFQELNPMTYENAQLMEVQLAEELRQKGYGVWQN